MARITQVVVTCDLEDGDVNAAESLSFTYAGKTYTLDLCNTHFDEVKGALEGFANAGHSAGRGGRGRRRSATPGRATRSSRPAAARAENRRPRYANGRVRRVMQSVTAGAYPERSGRHMRLHTGVGVAVRGDQVGSFLTTRAH